MPALKTVDWSSASRGTLLTGTTALGISACPGSDHLILLVLRLVSLRKGRSPAPTLNLQMPALKAVAGLHLLLAG